MPLGHLIVLLYIVVLYVRPQDWVPGIKGLPVAYILTPLGLVAGLPEYLHDRERFRIPQSKVLVGYLFVIFLSTLVAVDAASAIDQLWIFTRRALLFVMVLWALTSSDHIYRVVWGILLASLFLAFQAVLQATTGESWGGLGPYPGYTETRVRWYGDWDGPNVFGILFVMSTGIALELGFGPHSAAMRLLSLGLIGAYGTAIYFTNSRGAVVALAAATLYYLRRRFTLVKGGVLAAALLAGIVYLGPSRMSELSSSESSAGERTWVWEQGLDMLSRHPALGVGRGQFARNTDSGLLAHNNYVANFAETGLLGFFCFTGLLWFSYKGPSLVLASGLELDPKLGSLGRMMTTALVGYATATFFVVMEQELLYFFLGLSAAVYLVGRRSLEDLPPMEFTRRDVLSIFGVMAGVLGLVWLAAIRDVF